MFLQRSGYYHAPLTPFTASITHTKLTRLCFAITLLSATAERSFSVLRTLKKFTRSTMNASRLMHLALPHIHQNTTGEIIWTWTICSSRPNERRESLFGKKAALSQRAQYCMWIVQCVVHYCRFIWRIKIFHYATSEKLKMREWKMRYGQNCKGGKCRSGKNRSR